MQRFVSITVTRKSLFADGKKRIVMIDKQEFYFGSRDGEHNLHAIKWIPEAKEPVCILQIVHGMTE